MPLDFDAALSQDLDKLAEKYIYPDILKRLSVLTPKVFAQALEDEETKDLADFIIQAGGLHAINDPDNVVKIFSTWGGARDIPVKKKVVLKKADVFRSDKIEIGDVVYLKNRIAKVIAESGDICSDWIVKTSAGELRECDEEDISLNAPDISGLNPEEKRAFAQDKVAFMIATIKDRQEDADVF